jgi:restriction endonuclease S subunit
MKKMIEIMKQDIIIFYSWDIEIGNRYEETEWIEFNKVFTLEKGKIQSSKVEENEDGIILLTGAKEENFKKIIKQNESYLNGENIFISQSGNGDKRPIKYFNGECNYSDLMSVMHLNKNYINKINLKYIYYYLKNLQEHIENNYQKGSCNQSLDEKNFNRIKIQIPPIEHQNNSMKTISNIEETIKRWVIDIENILNDGEGKFMIYLEMEMESK